MWLVVGKLEMQHVCGCSGEVGDEGSVGMVLLVVVLEVVFAGGERINFSCVERERVRVCLCC